MATWLDSLLGRIFYKGTELELGTGLNFTSGLKAAKNNSTNAIDVTLDTIADLDVDELTVGALAIDDALHNTRLGAGTLAAVTTGSRNTAAGEGALAACTSGNYDTALGYFAGSAITAGSNNTLIGHQAGRAVTTGLSNVAVGYNSLQSDADRSRNVAIGMNALYAANATDGNVAVGYNAAVAVTSGSCVAVGYKALEALTTGTGNTAVGHQAGMTGNYSNTTCLGRGALATANDQVQLGDTSTTCLCSGITPRTAGLGSCGTAALPWAAVNTSAVYTGCLVATGEPVAVISEGVLAVSASRHLVDTEASAASDDLHSITGGVSGQFLVLRTVSGARGVVIKHSSVLSTFTGGDITMANKTKSAFLFCWQAGYWIVFAFV